MKKIILSTLLLAFAHFSWAQCELQDQWDSIPYVSGANDYSPFGKTFTPQGELKVLLLFGGFENDQLAQSASSFWPGSPGDADFETSLPNYQELFYTDISQFNDTNTDATISNFFYQMSKHSPNPLKIIGVPFSQRINIELTDDDIDYFYSALDFSSNLNIKLVEKLQSEEYADAFDYSLVDNRTNTPDYQTDNSNSPTDGEIDYAVIFWRHDFKTDPSSLSEGKSMTKFSSIGGFAGTSLNNEVSYEGENYLLRDGFTISRLMTHSKMYNTFMHELAHNNYGAPHNCGANGVLGEHFYATGGFGMMAPAGGNLINSANAWESWYNGWIELDESQDIALENGSPMDTVLTLGDFLATGDAIRIKLPHTGENGKVTDAQYLWLENHRGNTVFHERNRFLKDRSNTPLPPAPDGLIAFIEDCRSSRSEVNIWDERTNGIKMMHAGGNFDYSLSPIVLDSILEWWGTIYEVNTGMSNPLGSHNPLTSFRFDFQTFQNDVAIAGSQSDGEIQQVNDYNGDEKCEMLSTIKIDGELSWQNLGHDMAFQVGDKIGLGQGNVPHNYQHYHQNTDAISPIYLNGVSVEVLSMNEAGTLTLRIRLNDTDIEHCTRYTGGDIRLNPVPNAQYSLNLLPNVTLSLDQSGTASKTQIDPLTNDFVPPTHMYIEDEAYMHLEEQSTLRIKNGSTLSIKDGGRLEVHKNAKVVVEDGSYLIVEDNAEFYVQHGGKVIVEEGGQLIIKNTIEDKGIVFSDLTLQADEPAGEVRIAGDLVVEEGITLKNTGNGFFHFVDNGQFVLKENSRIDFNGTVNKNELIRLGNQVNLEIYDKPVSIRYAKIRYGTASQISVKGNDAYFNNVDFDALSSTSYAQHAINANSMQSLEVKKCDFKHFNTAINASNFGENVSCEINYNTVSNCHTTMAFSNMDKVTLYNNEQQFDFVGLTAENVNYLWINDDTFTKVDESGHLACQLKNVMAAYVVKSNFNSWTTFNTTAIKAVNSELILRDGTTIDGFDIGVDILDDGDNITMLTMGDLGCAKIINCNTGVKAKNSIFNIDAIIHAENNGDINDVVSNEFDNNLVHLDIYYTEPSPVSEVLVRGNWFNPPLISNESYLLESVNENYTSPSPHPTSDFVLTYQPIAVQKSYNCNSNTLYFVGTFETLEAWNSVKMPDCYPIEESFKDNFRVAELYFKALDDDYSRSSYQYISEIPITKSESGEWKDDSETVYTKECVQSVRVSEVRFYSSKCYSINGARKAAQNTNNWISFHEDCQYLKIFDSLGKLIHPQQATESRPDLAQGIYLLSQYSSNDEMLETNKISWK